MGGGRVSLRINKPSKIKQLSSDSVKLLFPRAFPRGLFWCLSPPCRLSSGPHPSPGWTLINFSVLIPLGLPLILDGRLSVHHCSRHTDSITRRWDVLKHFLFLSSGSPYISGLKFPSGGWKIIIVSFQPTPTSTRILHVHVLIQSPTLVPGKNFPYKLHFVDFFLAFIQF